MGYFLGWGRVQNCFWVYSYRLINFVSEFCSISALPCSFEFLWVVVVVPSDYFVSTQLPPLWLFCCWVVEVEEKEVEDKEEETKKM